MSTAEAIDTDGAPATSDVVGGTVSAKIENTKFKRKKNRGGWFPPREAQW